MFTAQRSGGTFFPNRGDIYPQLAQRGLAGAAATLSRQTKNTGTKTKQPSRVDAGSMVSAAALGYNMWNAGKETAPVVKDTVASTNSAGLNNLPNEGANAMAEAAAKGPLESDAFGKTVAPELNQANVMAAPEGETFLSGGSGAATNAPGTSLGSTVGGGSGGSGGILEEASGLAHAVGSGLETATSAAGEGLMAVGEGTAATAAAIGEEVSAGAQALWALLFL